MNVKTKNYCMKEVTEKQIEELKDKLGIGASEVVRRAIELLWENKIKNQGK